MAVNTTSNKPKNEHLSSYASVPKGYHFKNGKYAKAANTNAPKEATARDVSKPHSKKSDVIMFDTGNAYIPGLCYDHHQLTQEAKEKFPSATSMVYKCARTIYEMHKDAKEITYITHDHPDNDAILSIALASMFI